MRYFITGATGWIGSAVVAELVGSGNQVIGLARSDAAAAALTTAGAEVRRGTLEDLDVLRDASAESDGVVHLAFMHDAAFSGGFARAADADRAAVQTFGDVLAGSDRPLVIASGTLRVAPDRVVTEQDGHVLDPALVALGAGPQTRHGTAELVLSFASRGIRSSVVRLSPTNHGRGDHGFMATIVGIARDTGVSGYLGDGSNRWPAVHRLELSASLLPGARERAGGNDAPWRRGRGCPHPRYRRRHRPSPEPTGARHRRCRRGCTLHMDERLHRTRQPGVERADARIARMAAVATGAHRRS